MQQLVRLKGVLAWPYQGSLGRCINERPGQSSCYAGRRSGRAERGGGGKSRRRYGRCPPWAHFVVACGDDSREFLWRLSEFVQDVCPGLALYAFPGSTATRGTTNFSGQFRGEDRILYGAVNYLLELHHSPPECIR